MNQPAGMKKFCLSIAIFLIQLISYGQSSEVEPNNTFNTADDFFLNDQIAGDFAGTDTVDYHKLNFNYHGNFQLHLQVTNTGISTQTFRFNTYNSLTISGQFVGGMDFRQVSLAPGATYDGSIFVCGLAPDDLYVELKSPGDFDYTIEWFPVNVTPQDGANNNTFATATSFSFNAEKLGGIRYKFWGNSGFDSVDYFKSTLPAANYDSVYLYISAQNNDCSGPPNWIRYFLYKNGSTTPFTSGYVNNNSAVLPYQQVYSLIPLNTLLQGDELVVKFASNGAFSYSFTYKYLDPYFDNEDNCCTNNALTLDEGVTMGGNVGQYNTGTETFIDQFDNYKIVLPHDGAVKFWITAKNDECDQEYYYLSADILDQYGNDLTTTDLMGWESSPLCNELKTDSLKIRSFSAGTYYLRLRTDNNYDVHPGKISYSIRYDLVDSTGNIDVEPNGTTATAIPITAGQVKKGHVQFLKDAVSYDIRDYYKTVFPADGSIRVYLKTTYRAPDGGPSLQLNSSGFFGASSPNPPLNYFQADSVYLDTLNICGTGGGDLYFEFTSSVPYEYEFWYEIIDTSTSDNDIEPNNSFAEARLTGGGITQKGHIKYVNSTGTDDFDYYKFVYHATDSLKIYLQATNTSCLANRTVTFRLYNKALTNTVTKTKTNVAAGQTVTDSIKINIPITSNPDSMYLRVEANEAFKYQFSTNLRLPSSTFSISGDTAVCVTTQVYKAIRVADEPVTYNWSLPDGGGTISWIDSIATVIWTTTGNRRIQLYLSNSKGNSLTRQRNVIINGFPPSQVPVALNFARTLSTSSLPPGATCQWYKNDTLIPGATGTSYYAAAAGTFTVKFVNDCGPGPVSNAFTFPAAAQPQTITFPHVPTVTMSPSANAALTATASSSLPVFYQKISGPGNIINDTLFITGVGTIIIKAQQPGDDIYSQAPDKFDTITVIKGDQVITFDSIPDHIFDANKITLLAASSMEQTITYSIIAGATYASVSSNKITKKGAGTVTVRASQNGNGNYNAAAPVERTFCIGVRTLTPITGEANPCLNTYRYNAQKIPGANFVWTLSGGGILTTNNDTAWVQWQTPGTYTLTVKANSPCDPVYSDIQSLTLSTSTNLPGAVSNMLPANNAVDQQLPLTLSWIPGNNTVNYDLYLWDSATTEPVTPYVANINDIQYVIPKNSGLPYNRTYKWKIVAKNPCAQTIGAVQQFRLIPLPDLVVSEVQAPATATSGQTVTISWKVTNIGPGKTLLNQTWEDGIYFALDTVPHVDLNNLFPFATSWSQITAAGRPVLLGKKDRPSSLDSGQFYTNSFNFTIPIGYNFPVYVYVIAANNGVIYKLLQQSNLNDTARAPNRIIITQPPVPDLRVDSVFTPASIFSGSNMNITYKVKNYGVVTPVGGHWVDSFFISQNPLFDRNQCILLNAPKQNGSYYPNAPGAAVSNNTQLNTDSTVTRNVQVVIPNFIFGTWFIYVKTNAGTTTGNYIYEGQLNSNNVNQAQLQLYLTPTPKLTISTLTVPVNAASTTQPIGINWNIKNEGFRDNIEKNRGHYITMSTCQVPCPSGTPPNSICYGPSVIKDSVVFGGSYWLDRVYLSTDSTGLNIANATLVKEVNHGVENSGFYSDPVFPFYSFVSCPALAGGNINITNVISAGADFAKAENFTVPSGLAAGNYYVYVYTNPTKKVFEYPGTPQIRRSALPINIQRPDAMVSSVSVPANAIGGTAINVNYSVLNNGPGAVFNHIRRDMVYISNFPSFEGSAQVIGTNTFTEDLPVGSEVLHSFSYTLPPATTGVKYFYVVTNYDSLFKETNHVNNTSIAAAVSVTAALPADLIVSAVQPQDSVFIQSAALFKYTVINNGTGQASGTWTDSLFISCSPVFNAATAKFITKRTQARVIGAGGNYTDSFTHVIPLMSYEINTCFPQQTYAPGYFLVKTNANNGTYEGTATNNNITASSSRVVVNPLVDHVMVATSLNRDTVSFGTAFTASWKVKNTGYKPTEAYYYFYDDGIFFSADSIVNGNDVRAVSYRNYNMINRNDSLVTTKSVFPPDVPAGDYYVIAKSNYSLSITGEKIVSNNNNFVRNINGQAKKIHLVRPPLPDLTDTILSAPAAVPMGQPFTVIYKITNTGAAVTFPGSWRNDLRLSTDFQVQVGQVLLSGKTRAAPLAPGDFFTDTVTCTMPTGIAPGNYVLIGQANANNAVPESNISNNLGFGFIQAQLPDSTDLIVENITKPDTVYLGYTMDTAKWKIRNISNARVRGWLTDGIYLSAGNLLDSSAALLGTKVRYIDLLPNETDSLKLTPRVTTATEGNYNLFVKTDLLNNIIELDKTNNTGVAATPVYVKAKELKLGIPELNTLQTINRYYKIRIPDSLRGATVLVTLKTNDSLLVHNEMFIGGGFVPTPASYDYRFEIPNYGNQQIVISDAGDSVYYIMYRCVTSTPPVQNITLRADVLPFAVLNVQTNSGGNIGNVTVRIKGSLFRDSMMAKLSNGTTTIYASAVYYTNSTQVYATFPLQGKPLGVYNLTLTKPDSSSAILPNGFTIVTGNNGGILSGGGVNTGPGNGNAPGCDPGAASGLNSQLAVELVVPEKVVRGRPVVIVINFSNPTNFDLPVQSRILYNDEEVKMAFTKEGIPYGTSSLYLEFTEQGGPPGIIRPGGGGSIVIHCIAPRQVPEDGSVLFKLQ